MDEHDWLADRFEENRTHLSDVPHFSRSIWAPTSGGVGRAVDAGGDV
jgi:hypothetical protein